MLHPDTPSKRKDIGHVIGEALDKLGWSPEIMAHRCGITTEDIRQILAGAHPLDFDTFMRIASALEMDLQISFAPKPTPDLN